MNILDIANTIAPSAEKNIIGIRPGEKLHEQMISEEDSFFTYEYEGFYKILPSIYGWDSDVRRIGDGKKVPDGFMYRSDTNTDWMSQEQLKKIILNIAR